MTKVEPPPCDDCSSFDFSCTGLCGKNLRPNIAGRFDTFEKWVDKASRHLVGTLGSTGEHLPAMCIDSKGRRCHVGKDFMRARDEGTFPVYYFWDCTNDH